MLPEDIKMLIEDHFSAHKHWQRRDTQTQENIRNQALEHIFDAPRFKRGEIAITDEEIAILFSNDFNFPTTSEQVRRFREKIAN